MAEDLATRRFRVRNLDCASCAAKIEQGLQQLEEVQEATLDFAGLILKIRAHDMQHIVETVRRIDPAVELIPEEKAPSAADGSQGETYQPVRELLLLAASTVLFGIYLLWGDRWHTTAWIILEYAVAMGAYLLAGLNVFLGAWRTLRRGDFFDENVLMVIATAGAIAIHALSEAVAVMLFFKVGELLQQKAVMRSRRSIRALLAIRPEYAHVQTGGGLQTVPPEQVQVGETILVKPGEKIPLDGTVLQGESQVDASPLTGETRPRARRAGDPVLAGTINLTAALTMQVAKPYHDSSVAHILHLVENASTRKAATEKFITVFSRYYTPAVVLGAALIAFGPPLLIPETAFHTWIYRALVLLVISCPCALMISVPLGYFGGIGRASRRGILVKGSNFIDALAQVKTVVFDKTGTLTQGVFKVQEVVAVNGYSQDQVLAYAAAAEFHSNHPIATSIVQAFADRGGQVDGAAILDHAVMEGGGVHATYDGRQIMVGNDALLHLQQIEHDQCVIQGTVAHVTIDREYAGYLLIDDHLKPDAAGAVDALRRTGVKQVIMLTGDNHCAAERVSRELRLDGFHADLLPEDKVRLFEELVQGADHKGKVAFVGDGINDAPTLARADVGVAMGALGSPAAVETADVVLTTDSPAKMAEAMAIARQTRQIVWQNIVLALLVKAVFVGLGAVGLASMWEAVFADMGTALLAVLNATRALGKGGTIHS